MDEKENLLVDRKLFDLANDTSGNYTLSAANGLQFINSQQTAFTIKQENSNGGDNAAPVAPTAAVVGEIHLNEKYLTSNNNNINSNSIDENVNIKLEDNVNLIDEEEEPEVDIHISNVVCNFSTRCHLNLRKVALNGCNVVYKREQGMISMKIRNPNVTASIWSSGKITVTGATSEESGKRGCRRVARVLQKMGFRVKFTNFRVVNVLGTVILPFGIKITQFTEQYRNVCSYEPELHPGATYRFPEVRAVLKIFQTGAITITAPSVNKVQLAVEHIYPLVFDFKKEKPNVKVNESSKRRSSNDQLLNKRKKETDSSKLNNRKRLKFIVSSDEEEDDEEVDIDEDDPEEEALMTDEEEEED